MKLDTDAPVTACEKVYEKVYVIFAWKTRLYPAIFGKLGGQINQLFRAKLKSSLKKKEGQNVTY